MNFFYKKVDFLDINVRFRKVCNKVNLRINLLVRVASSFFRTLKMTSIAFQDSVAVAVLSAQWEKMIDPPPITKLW